MPFATERRCVIHHPDSPSASHHCAYKKNGDASSGRQQRQIPAITESDGLLTYIPGTKNPVTINDVHIGIDDQALAREQQQDPETNTFKTAITNLKWQYVSIDGEILLCVVSTGRPRPLVPKSFRRRVFNTIHRLSHPSIRSTIQLIKYKFVWHCKAKNIREWAHRCDVSNTVKYIGIPRQFSVMSHNHSADVHTSSSM